MGVRIEGELNAGVAQTLLDYLRMYALLEHKTGVSVTCAMEPYALQADASHELRPGVSHVSGRSGLPSISLITNRLGEGVRLNGLGTWRG